MITETGQSIYTEVEAPQLITAILPHPLHGRLVERVLLMVSSQLNVKGVRYRLSWRAGDLAFYQPIPANS
jgi:hypothetical protein